MKLDTFSILRSIYMFFPLVFQLWECYLYKLHSFNFSITAGAFNIFTILQNDWWLFLVFPLVFRISESNYNYFHWPLVWLKVIPIICTGLSDGWTLFLIFLLASQMAEGYFLLFPLAYRMLDRWLFLLFPLASWMPEGYLSYKPITRHRFRAGNQNLISTLLTWREWVICRNKSIRICDKRCTENMCGIFIFVLIQFCWYG